MAVRGGWAKAPWEKCVVLREKRRPHDQHRRFTSLHTVANNFYSWAIKPWKWSLALRFSFEAKSRVSRITELRYVPWLYCLIPVPPWTNYLISLTFSLLIYKMGIVIVTSPTGLLWGLNVRIKYAKYPSGCLTNLQKMWATIIIIDQLNDCQVDNPFFS